jgi:hypothetical protein
MQSIAPTISSVNTPMDIAWLLQIDAYKLLSRRGTAEGAELGPDEACSMEQPCVEVEWTDANGIGKQIAFNLGPRWHTCEGQHTLTRRLAGSALNSCTLTQGDLANVSYGQM